MAFWYWIDYTWIFACGVIVSFLSAYAIGANDVANAFATSVGSKTLKLWQACAIAAVFEFAGALGLGGEVSKAIAGSIAKLDKFDREPEVLMYGMLCALVAAFAWVMIATYMEMAVSTTHSIVGAIIGFSLCFEGASSVVWYRTKDEFPYAEGVVIIVISWFTSPLAAAVTTPVFFLVTRTLVLRRSQSLRWAYWAMPVVILITLWINSFFVITKAAKSRVSWDTGKCAWIAACIAGGTAFVSIFTLTPYVKWRINKENMEAEAAKAAAAEDVKEGKDLESAEQNGEKTAVELTGWRKWAKKAEHLTTRGMKVDIHKAVEKDDQVHAMHANAEVFDPNTERVFSYVQVITACCVSFAHGANDVANAVGPLAAIYFIWRHRYIQSSVDMPIWILAIGGVGIVVGLATYGYNIMRALGVKMCTITPSRGYCIELSTALVLSIGSRYGLPLSSTHVQVGGTFAMGLLEGGKGANLLLMFKFVVAWVMTLIIAGFVCAGLFSQGAYAPSIQMANQISDFEEGVQQFALNTYKVLNSTLYATCGPYNASVPTSVSCWSNNAKLNSTIQSDYKTCQSYYQKTQGKVMKVQTVDPYEFLQCMNKSETIYRNYSTLTINP